MATESTGRLLSLTSFRSEGRTLALDRTLPVDLSMASTVYPAGLVPSLHLEGLTSTMHEPVPPASTWQSFKCVPPPGEHLTKRVNENGALTVPISTVASHVSSNDGDANKSATNLRGTNAVDGTVWSNPGVNVPIDTVC